MFGTVRAVPRLGELYRGQCLTWGKEGQLVSNLSTVDMIRRIISTQTRNAVRCIHMTV
jgi:hypothetical protein